MASSVPRSHSGRIGDSNVIALMGTFIVCSSFAAFYPFCNTWVVIFLGRVLYNLGSSIFGEVPIEFYN